MSNHVQIDNPNGGHQASNFSIYQGAGLLAMEPEAIPPSELRSSQEYLMRWIATALTGDREQARSYCERAN